VENNSARMRALNLALCGSDWECAHIILVRVVCAVLAKSRGILLVHTEYWCAVGAY
jgi:hypothetical protein